jgi:hypothetical protein
MAETATLRGMLRTAAIPTTMDRMLTAAEAVAAALAWMPAMQPGMAVTPGKVEAAAEVTLSRSLETVASASSGATAGTGVQVVAADRMALSLAEAVEALAALLPRPVKVETVKCV